MTSIKSKILKTGKIDWRKILPLQNQNFKDLTETAFKKLRQSIINNNFISPFVCWENEGKIYTIDGVHRQKVLLELEREKFVIPPKLDAIFLDCKNRKEAAKLLLVYSSIYAKTTMEGFDEFLSLEGLDFEDLKMEIDIAGLNLDNFTQNEIDEEKLDDVPEPQKEAVSKLGDLFLLDGKHRVLCGDSTKKEDVEKLMDGKKADMVFTDPPYGVSYDGGHATDKRREKLKGDDTTDLYEPCCQMSHDFTTKEAPLYLWHAGVKGIAAAAAAAKAGYEIRCEIVWNKNLAQYGAISAQYKQKHEPCYYCYKKGKTVNWCGDTKQVTVWDVNRSSKNEFHPTQKPVELVLRAIKNHSVGLILDFFGGSGSTLVGCEQSNRTAYLLELDPIYIDVILRRYHTLYPDKEIKCLNRKDFNFKKLYEAN